MKNYYRKSLAHIDLDALSFNVKALQDIHQSTLIGVVKANAYGHGDVMISKHLESLGINFLAVASLDEAIHLRRNNIQSEILVLGYVNHEDIQDAIEHNITLSLLSLTWLKSSPSLKDLKLHIKINTGLNRFGIHPKDVKEALSLCIEKQARTEGIFTHFASSDEPNSPQTDQQYTLFESIVNSLNYNFKWIHASNSGAAVNFKTPICNAVRIGLSLYGYSDYPIELKPLMRLSTQIHEIKLVKKGEAIGYGANYITQEDEWIATLSIGYADGLHRLYQGAQCYVEGQYATYVGRISMDIAVIKLEKEVPVLTEVEILGNHIDIFNLAKHIGTIPYELFTMVSDRIPRVYYKNKEIIEVINYRL